MLGLQSVELHKLRLNETNDRLESKLSAIKELYQLIYLRPAHTLSLSNTLNWIVRTVEPVPINSSNGDVGISEASSVKIEGVTAGVKNVVGTSSPLTNKSDPRLTLVEPSQQTPCAQNDSTIEELADYGNPVHFSSTYSSSTYSIESNEEIPSPALKKLKGKTVVVDDVRSVLSKLPHSPATPPEDVDDDSAEKAVEEDYVVV